MTTRLLLVVAAALLVWATAQAQVRITSLNSNGTLVWTNSVARGAYSIEAANSLIGPWTPVASVIDTNTTRTNFIIGQIPLTNSQGYFRVGWTIPHPGGTWDYQAHDMQNTLVVTGKLTITSTTLASTNDPNNLGYSVIGNYNLQYAGPPTNNLGHLGWGHVGAGDLDGSFNSGSAAFIIQLPRFTADAGIRLSRDIWANTYTGEWRVITIAGAYVAGRFKATKE